MAASLSVPGFALGSFCHGDKQESRSLCNKIRRNCTFIVGRRSRSTSKRCSIISCSQQEDAKPSFSFDFSSLRDLDVDSIRRANYNARRRLIQNRGVPQIYPQVYGQATKIEKVWKEWKKAEKDSYSRGLEYLTPEVIDPEDEVIIANDGLFIEKKYPDFKTKATIITKEGEVLH